MADIIRGQLPSIESSFPLEVAISMGFIPNYGTIDKFGASFNISGDSVVQDAWEGDVEYTFSTNSDIDTISSSSPLDVGHLIVVEGIVDPEQDNDKTVGYAILNGQNKVNIYSNPELTGDTLSFWRVWRKENEADAVEYGGVGSINGVVYCYVDTAITNGVPNDISQVRSIITNGNNQTLMGLYTVPPKHVGFLFRGEVGMEFNAAPASPQQIRAQYQSRRYKKVFKVKKPISLLSNGTSVYTDKRTFVDRIPALTDIKITKVTASADMGMFVTFDIMLVNENRFSAEYLKSIGQPGY